MKLKIKQSASEPLTYWHDNQSEDFCALGNRGSQVNNLSSGQNGGKTTDNNVKWNHVSEIGYVSCVSIDVCFSGFDCWWLIISCSAII